MDRVARWLVWGSVLAIVIDLAPSLAALSYIHFCLEALRRERRGAVVSVAGNAEVGP